MLGNYQSLRVLQDSDPDAPFRVAVSGEEAARRGSRQRRPRDRAEAGRPLGAVRPAPEAEGQEEPAAQLDFEKALPVLRERDTLYNSVS